MKKSVIFDNFLEIFSGGHTYSRRGGASPLYPGWGGPPVYRE